MLAMPRKQVISLPEFQTEALLGLLAGLVSNPAVVGVHELAREIASAGVRECDLVCRGSSMTSTK